jgi:DNA-binding MarR family transcriptional regulator
MSAYSTPIVSSTVDELVDRGLVDRSADPIDRRRNIISITPAGRAHFRRLDKIVTDVQDEVLAPLSLNQREQLIRLLTRILEYHPDSGA